MSPILIFILGLFFIFLFFLIKILINKKTETIPKKRLNINKKIHTKNSFDFNMIKIPSKIKEIDSLSLIKLTTELYKIFKSLTYITKDNNELNSSIEWNNYEISLFLFLLQNNKNIPMQDSQEIFHSSILSLTKEQVLGEIKSIITKYNKSITKDNIAFLKNQVIWSAKEISIILYYLSLKKIV